MQLLFWFPYISVGFIPSQPQLAWEKGFVVVVIKLF
jgi:hypothetical protein